MKKFSEEEALSSASYDEWISKANAAEDVAKGLDRKARAFFPINFNLFLEAARHSRRSARFQHFAHQSTKVSTLRSIALSNYHTMTGNVYKSLANFFYYSLKLSRAATFFGRALRQYAEGESLIPKGLDNYTSLLQESTAHQVHLGVLVALCKGGLSKQKGNWVEAIEHYRFAKREYQKLRTLNSNYTRSLNLGAAIQATERDIQVCRVIVSLNNLQLDKALKHAEEFAQNLKQNI